MQRGRMSFFRELEGGDVWLKFINAISAISESHKTTGTGARDNHVPLKPKSSAVRNRT